MSYQAQNDLYRDLSQRGRMEMCVREQGYIFAGDGRPDIAALGMAVVANQPGAMEAVIAAVCVGPNWATVGTDDGALLAAVQAVWPTVAAALHPHPDAT